MIRKAQKIIGLISYTIRPSATFGAVVLVAAAYHPQSGDWVTFVRLLLSAFCGAAFCFLMNDVYDRQKDLLNQKRRPIATGELPLRYAFFFAFVLGAIFLFTTYFLGGLIFVLAVIFLLLTSTYSFINFQSGFLANIIVAFVVAGTQWGVWLIKPHPLLLPMACFLFFFTLPREMLLDWLDREGDQAVGKRSLAISCTRLQFNLLIGLFMVAATCFLFLIIVLQKPKMMVSVLLVMAALTGWGSFIRFFIQSDRKNALFGVRFSHLTFAMIIIAMFLR